MKCGWLTVALLCVQITGLPAGSPDSDSAQQFLDHGQYKEAIASYLELIAKAPPEEQSSLKARLARVYTKDQDLEKAFQVFLEALDTAPLQTSPSISEEEKCLYDEALKTYLDQSNVSIAETANIILKKYASTVSQHPDYYSLKLVVAMAKANLSRFDEFFIDFYDAYQRLPQHHLSHKTKAILHIKLFERVKNQEEKQFHRERILEWTEKSMDLYPADRSLYKMAIAFSPDEESRRQAIVKFLPRIIDQNIIIPRCDLLFYVKQAVAVGQAKLAQRLIDKAREWYHYSKILEQAQGYVDSEVR